MTDAGDIRRVFLEAQPTCLLPDAAALLGMSGDKLRGWVDAGEIEGVEMDDVVVVPWAELVSFGMDFWSQEALGAEAAEVIPELLLLADPRCGLRGCRWSRGSGSQRSITRR